MTSPAIPADGQVRYPHRPYDPTAGGSLISGTAPFALIRLARRGGTLASAALGQAPACLLRPIST